MSDDVRRRWFDRQNESWAVKPEARALVSFERRNLVAHADALEASSVDIVFCRNVLIYLDEPSVTLVLSRLAEALRPGGSLVVSSAETGLYAQAGLGAHQVGDVWVHTKGETANTAPPPPRAVMGAHALEARPRPPAAPARTRRRAAPPPEPTPQPPAPQIDEAIQSLERGWGLLADDPESAAAEARRAILLDRTLVAAHVLAASAAHAQSLDEPARRALRHARRYLSIAPPAEILRGGGGLTAAQMDTYCTRLDRMLRDGRR